MNKYFKLVLYTCFSILVVISLIPFLMMLVNATRSNLEITKGLALIPGRSLLENWREAVAVVPLPRGLLNSAFIAILSTLLGVYFSSMVAYGFNVYEFRGKKVLFTAVLVTMMVPSQLSFIGFYQLMRTYSMLDSYIPLIIPSIANASTVFFLKQYGQQVISQEIIESGRMDAAGEFQIFNRIVLPMFYPAMATMAIFSFVGSWNSYLQPLLLLSDKKKFTIPLMIRVIESSNLYKPAYGATYLAIALSVIPILIIFVVLSKKIVGGLTAGAVKG